MMLKFLFCGPHHLSRPFRPRYHQPHPSTTEAGYEVTRTASPDEAEQLLSQGAGDLLVYEWPFADKLKWIKKRFNTIERNPNVTFTAFLAELNQFISQSS